MIEDNHICLALVKAEKLNRRSKHIDSKESMPPRVKEVYSRADRNTGDQIGVLLYGGYGGRHLNEVSRSTNSSSEVFGIRVKRIPDKEQCRNVHCPPIHISQAIVRTFVCTPTLCRQQVERNDKGIDYSFQKQCFTHS